MNRPLLPPRGVFVPTEILYNKELSATQRDTFEQIYGLAWGQQETPEISIDQLIEITGKSKSILYGHMAALRKLGALCWRNPKSGTLIFSFQFATDSEKQECPYPPIPINSESIKEVIKDSVIPENRNIPKNRKTAKPKKETTPAAILGPIVDALAEVTGMDKTLNYGRMSKEAKDLHKSGYTAEQIRIVYSRGGAWYKKDWRGKRGEIPQLGAIRPTIKALLNGNGHKPEPDLDQLQREWDEAGRQLEEENRRNANVMA